MLFGNPLAFGIESCYAGEISSQHFVHYRMLVGGASVGDFADWADLSAILNWHVSLILENEERTFPRSGSLSDMELWESIYVPVYSGDIEESAKETLRGCTLKDRHHIDHIGMSALDQFGVILVEMPDAQQRLVWGSLESGHLGGVTLPSYTIESVATEFVRWTSPWFPTPSLSRLLDEARAIAEELRNAAALNLRNAGAEIMAATKVPSAEVGFLRGLREALRVAQAQRRISADVAHHISRLIVQLGLLIVRS